MRIVELSEESKNNILENLLKRSPNSYGKYESAVAEILLNIKTRKDEALFEYTKNFDKADIGPDNIVVTEEEIEDNLITYCNSNALVEHAKSKGGLDNISVTILKINKLLW